MAQLAAQLFRNQQVGGSNPPGGFFGGTANIIKNIPAVVYPVVNRRIKIFQVVFGRQKTTKRDMKIRIKSLNGRLDIGSRDPSVFSIFYSNVKG